MASRLGFFIIRFHSGSQKESLALWFYKNRGSAMLPENGSSRLGFSAAQLQESRVPDIFSPRSNGAQFHRLRSGSARAKLTPKFSY
jgi:hypothetical protein